MDKYSYISNAHVDYIDEMYRAYKADQHSVDESWQRFFEGFEFSASYPNGSSAATAGTATDEDIKKEVKVRNLIYAYRGRGHLLAKTNPVRQRKDRRARLNLEDFDLTEADLDTVFQSGIAVTGQPMKLRDIIAALEKIYTQTIGFEFMYIREPEVLQWFLQKVEKESLEYQPTAEIEHRILSKLNEAVVFENFLQTKYLGQKRFSLEGAESTIPGLDAIINRSAELGTKEVVIGMAHRGRLNVLVNIVGKTYEAVFNEFEGTPPEEVMGDGDVKYHMGFSNTITTESGIPITLQLAPNPSHLEAVDPVVEGYARAKIDGLYHGNVDKVLPILIHGDAAVAGQGVVYEVVQMAKLEGYHVGGTIHFVINNQVGFTTDFDDARSSIYCTDVAKIIDSPVIHVNGDDVEAVVFACKLAAEFREKFNRDIFIDMVCYRRHGHNETDEPKFTQPKLYNAIAKHQNPREIYNEKLAARGKADADLAKKMDAEFRQMLQDRLNMVKQKAVPYKLQPMEEAWAKLRTASPTDFEKSPETGISAELIEKVGKALARVPEGFKPLRQIERLLADREDQFFKSKQLNWASAELLAYGSLLAEGKVVRMSGQDVRRGTFSHRHAVLLDTETNEPYFSLDYIAEEQERMRIYNSFLSEYAVLGFEFGYSMANPDALVIWEAQFGDFANGAQVMIDQFITSTESKWGRMNALVMLLPHGYEGQGPEHSNARPERFLQLSAEYNIIVANLTTPANLFHALRRQLTWEFRKPLVIMSPKSLLREPLVSSPIADFQEGRFQEVIGDDYVDAKQVKKVLLCTGKVYYDLYKKQQAEERKDIAIIRVEQLHPFPSKAVHFEISKYSKAKIVWVQEEPENMGYWTYVNRAYTYDSLSVIARKASASPATGYSKVHEKEQQAILEKAFA
ncbi:2-oxoglutarate dehydrogenase E1 component [Eisenibacter elegans]|jgi:2-oxoglutarate dehydrogenase E1 component|uniref:2-oxoglutarate dehydrogenase E1 component n=1 Tax=Eisenibacter elegans TaxID=997 RepID=UPI00040FC670|nr:2-oxoglutarate dehydrogenase E1 component [Eisenibacter elegans]